MEPVKGEYRMVEINKNVLELFNNITLDIRDYLFDRSGQTGEQFICTNQKYNKSIFWLSDRKVTVSILKDSDNNDFINIYIGNSYDEMLLISTSKNKFTVSCIPNISPYKFSLQCYFIYSWKECELEKFIDIARTRFHEYNVKIIAAKKELDYKLNILKKVIKPYIDSMTDDEVRELANKMKNELKRGE